MTAVTRGSKVHPERFGNHALRVSSADASISAAAGVQDLDMGDDAAWMQYPRSPLGTLRIAAAGEQTVTVVADKIDPVGNGLKLIAIELTPVG